MIEDHEYLERVVKGINAIENPNADVRWNVDLDGRQFDVVINFTAGPYRFLVLVEVKDRGRNTSAAEIEAFITKANDQQANKIVFVTKSGYQAGAIRVAKKHGVELFRVRFVPGDPLKPGQKTYAIMKKDLDGSLKFAGLSNSIQSSDRTVSFDEPTIVNFVEGCTLVYSDHSICLVPNEPTQMQYYMEKSKFSDGRSIADVIAMVAGEPIPNGTKAKRTINFETTLSVFPPDCFFLKEGSVQTIEVSLRAGEATPITGNTRIEPTSFSPEVEYENVISGQVVKANTSQLPVGERTLEVGKFYFGYFPLRYFYCESIIGNEMTLFLVESFQHGELFQAKTKQNRAYSWAYIPVEDKKIISRLRSRLAKLKGPHKQSVVVTNR